MHFPKNEEPHTPACAMFVSGKVYPKLKIVLIELMLIVRKKLQQSIDIGKFIIVNYVSCCFFEGAN